MRTHASFEDMLDDIERDPDEAAHDPNQQQTHNLPAQQPTGQEPKYIITENGIDSCAGILVLARDGIKVPKHQIDSALNTLCIASNKPLSEHDKQVQQAEREITISACEKAIEYCPNRLFCIRQMESLRAGEK